jgi:hypothetical protein
MAEAVGGRALPSYRAPTRAQALKVRAREVLAARTLAGPFPAALASGGPARASVLPRRAPAASPAPAGAAAPLPSSAPSSSPPPQSSSLRPGAPPPAAPPAGPGRVDRGALLAVVHRYLRAFPDGAPGRLWSERRGRTLEELARAAEGAAGREVLVLGAVQTRAHPAHLPL